MRWNIIKLLGALSVTRVSAQFDSTSAPFNLIVTSTDSTINGATLFPCHEGAAIEALCPDSSTKLHSFNASAPTFNFNYSSHAVASSSAGIVGDLIYNLPLYDNQSVSSAMMLSYTPSSNIAVPLFYPGSKAAQEVAFDKCNDMNIQAYVDDTTSPPTGGNDTAYYRWYICTTIVTSYTYPTLSWVLGNGEPENPTCQKVDVRRLFA